jgi:hypothetical protein
MPKNPTMLKNRIHNVGRGILNFFDALCYVPDLIVRQYAGDDRVAVGLELLEIGHSSVANSSCSRLGAVVCL